MLTYEERQALRKAADRKAIVAARLTGFMDCSEVFDALGFERVNAGGETPQRYAGGVPLDPGCWFRG